MKKNKYDYQIPGFLEINGGMNFVGDSSDFTSLYNKSVLSGKLETQKNIKDEAEKAADVILRFLGTILDKGNEMNRSDFEGLSNITRSELIDFVDLLGAHGSLKNQGFFLKTKSEEKKNELNVDLDEEFLKQIKMWLEDRS